MLEQDLVLERPMVALDLALGHRMIGLAPGMGHAVLLQPRTELGGEVGGPVVELQLEIRNICFGGKLSIRNDYFFAELQTQDISGPSSTPR